MIQISKYKGVECDNWTYHLEVESIQTLCQLIDTRFDSNEIVNNHLVFKFWSYLLINSW